jgi:hypothetical protein
MFPTATMQEARAHSGVVPSVPARGNIDRRRPVSGARDERPAPRAGAAVAVAAGRGSGPQQLAIVLPSAPRMTSRVARSPIDRRTEAHCCFATPASMSSVVRLV